MRETEPRRQKQRLRDRDRDLCHSHDNALRASPLSTGIPLIQTWLIDASGTNATPFKISVSNSFVCGTEIALSLNLTYAGGSKSIPFTIPTCAGGPDQTIPPASSRRVIRRRPIVSAGTAARAPAAARPARAAVSPERTITKTFTFTNTSGAPRCYTVTINAALGGPGDIESVAYDQVYDPTKIDTNYLGDSWYQRPRDHRRPGELLVHRSRGA